MSRVSHHSSSPAGRQRRQALTLGLVLLVVAVAFAPLAAVATHGASPPAPQWIDVKNLPFGLEGSMGGWMGGHFYVAGGHTTGNQDVASLYRWSGITGADDWFDEGVTMRYARAEGSAAVVNNVLYVFGGRGPACGPTGGVCGGLDAYSSGTWTELPNMSVPRAGLGGTGVGGYLFAIGGRDGTTPTSGVATNVTEIYDIANATWLPGPPLPDARSELSATLWHPATNSIYVFGGYNTTTGTALGSVLQLDLNAGPAAAWTDITSLLTGSMTPRYAATVGWCGDNVIVAGGITGGAQSRSRTTLVEAFSVVNRTWWTLPSLPYNFSEAAAGHTGNGNFMMMAGSGIHGAALNRTLMLDCTDQLDPQGFANDGLTNEAGGGAPPAPSLQPCQPLGAKTFTGSVRVNGTFSGAVRVGAFAPVNGEPTCGQVVEPQGPGDYGTGRQFSMGNFEDGPFYRLVAWIDQDGNGRPDAGEPNHNVTSDFAVSVTQHFLIELQQTPPQTGPVCNAGSATASGWLRVTNGTFDPAQVRVGAFVGSEDAFCVAGVATPQGTTSEFDSGVSWSIPNLDGAAQYGFLAWIDANGNGVPDDDGPVSDLVPSVATSGIDVHLDLSATEGDPECTGTGSLHVWIWVNMTLAGPLRYEVVDDDCVTRGAVPTQGQNPTSFVITGVRHTSPVDLFVYADADGDVEPDMEEQGRFLPNLDAASNPTVTVAFAQHGPGGGHGGPAPHAPQGPGDHWVNATAFYNGTRNVTGVFMGLMGEDGGDAGAGEGGAGGASPSDCFAQVSDQQAGFHQQGVWATIHGQHDYDHEDLVIWARSGPCDDVPPSAYQGSFEEPPGSGNMMHGFSIVLNDDYDPWNVTIYVDANENGRFDEGEPSGSRDITASLGGTFYTYDLHVGGAPPPGGDGHEQGDAFFGGFGTAPSAGSPVRLNVTGFTPGNWTWFSWLETDNVPGPGAFEPFGFLRVGDAELPENRLDVAGNRTDVVLEFRDPPEEGWPPEILPGHGGGHDGPPACSASAASNVTGFVRNGRGDPLGPGQAFVEVGNLTSRQHLFVDVGAEGSYRCGVAPGTYRVQGHSDTEGFYFEDVEVASGEEKWVNLTLSFDFRPPYTRPTTFYGGTAWGNVTVGGSPVSGARVSVFRPHAEGSGPCQHRDPQANTLNTCGDEAFTNATGGFVITYLGPGTYDVHIDGSDATPQVQSLFLPGHLVIPGDVSASAVTAIDLGAFAFAPPAYIRGHVTYDGPGGSPVAAENVEVHAWPSCGPGEPCGHGSFDETDANGFYELVVSPGSFSLSAFQGRDYVGTPLSAYNVHCWPGSPDCIQVPQEGTAWVNITMSAGGVVRGVVADGAGTPVRAYVNAQKCDSMGPGPGHPPTCTWAWGQTDTTHGPQGPSSSGWYNVSLEPGTWELRFEPDRQARPDLSTLTRASVVVTAGAITWINETFTDGGRLRGNVTAGGQPVTYVNLRAEPHAASPHEPRGQPVAWAFAGGDGRYDMPGIPPGVYDITVEPGHRSGYQQMTIRNVSVNASQLRWLDFELRTGGTLAGYVVGSDGLPIQGVMVDAFWHPEIAPGTPMGPIEFPQAGGYGHAVTDANGQYRIAGLVDGTYGLSLNPPFGTSYTSARLDPFRDDLPDVAADQVTWRNFTLGSGGQIRACVKDAGGAAVAFSWVSVFSRDAGFGGGEPTRSDGCATIRGVRPGTYSLEVSPPPGSDLARKVVDGVQVLQGNATSVDVTLGGGVRLTGRVLDANGQGIPFVGVHAFQISDGPGGPAVMSFAFTDAQGAYSLNGLVPGRYGMHLQPPPGQAGLSSKFIPEVRVGDTGRANYDIVLGGGGWIHGTVLADGAPLANAWVSAWSFESGSGGGVQTDALGRFNVSGLSAASDYRFEVFPPFNRGDLAAHQAFPLAVVGGAGTDRGAIALTAGSSVTGRVVDANGRAVEYAFVNVDASGGFGYGMTDAGGNFTVRGFSATSGSDLSVFVQPGPHGTFVGTRATFPWSDADGDGVMAVGDIVVSGGVNLTGRVLRDGGGVEDVELHVWPGMPYQGPPVGGAATTGTGGWFNVTGLPQGQGWDLSARPRDGTPGNFTPWAVWTNGTTTYVEINLSSSSGDIRILVVDGASAPIQGATVDCGNPALRAGRTNTTDANGVSDLRGLPPGSDYRCRAAAPGYAPAATTVTVSAGGVATQTITLAQTTPVSVFGNFTNAAGRASGHFVLLVPANGGEATGFAVTNATGAFEAHNLPPDVYDLKVVNSTNDVVASIAGLDLTNVPGQAYRVSPAIAHGDNRNGS